MDSFWLKSTALQEVELFRLSVKTHVNKPRLLVSTKKSGTRPPNQKTLKYYGSLPSCKILQFNISSEICNLFPEVIYLMFFILISVL